jgi:hypothetical protein
MKHHGQTKPLNILMLTGMVLVRVADGVKSRQVIPKV